MADVFMRKYATATTVVTELWQQDGTAVQPTWTPAAGEVLVSIDEGAFANIGTLPTHEGNGVWSFPLTVAETTGARIAVATRDAGTDVLDKTFIVETIAHPSSQHGATISDAVIAGTAQTGTLSTTSCTSDLTGYADDELIGRTIVFIGGTAAGQAARITDYANTNGQITYTTIETAPADEDPFRIV